MIISCVVIASMFLDNLMTKIPIYNYKSQSSFAIVYFFAFEVLLFILFQFLFLSSLRKTSFGSKDSSQYGLSFQFLYKLIVAVQALLIVILLSILVELLFQASYHTIFVTLAVCISCFTALGMLSMLVYRFLRWFKFSRDYVILSYSIVVGILVFNSAIILAYLATSLNERPSIINFTRASVNDAHVVQIPLYSAFTITSNLTFVAMWVGSVLLLRGYSQSLGKLKFWIIVSLPLLYFLSQSQFIFGPFILSHRFVEPLTFFRIYIITFASTKLIGGLMFAIPYFIISMKVYDERISNYLKLASVGIILYFLSSQISSLPLAPYPPFGLVSTSFMGLSSILIMIGIYYSAVTSSQNVIVRRFLRKSIQKETRFIGSMASSEFELTAVNNISNSIENLSKKMENYSGIETVDIESLRALVRIAIHEKQSVSGNLQGGAKVYDRKSRPFGKSWEKWAELWWLWCYSQPSDSNPISDLTGKYSASGQLYEKVWFLAGTFGGRAERICQIPSGRAIFFPIINDIISFATDPHLKTGEELRKYAKKIS